MSTTNTSDKGHTMDKPIEYFENFERNIYVNRVNELQEQLFEAEQDLADCDARIRSRIANQETIKWIINERGVPEFKG